MVTGVRSINDSEAIIGHEIVKAPFVLDKLERCVESTGEWARVRGGWRVRLVLLSNFGPTPPSVRLIVRAACLNSK